MFLAPLFAGAGAASAGGALALARRADEGALLDAGSDAGELDVGEREQERGGGG
ncbi:MAG: hypothetical protein GWO00_18575 [Gemmatimonadetes bacterium]|nr:hypothetical protein [Gemmatimonadota bacterium]NIT89050.1 hypothetical protein [Gemmatimonadota bacterium]NIU32845.1 hypothetical protein [Gemmatimonadota bacterium]NIV63215.1 hypothetical protein [Gemmatimonadota bacterium]NIW65931.1 hypothetical protein [Gemmatimonadota bacterium]